MYEVLLADKEVIETRNYKEAMNTFNFYAKEKKLFNLDFVIIMNKEENFYLEA